MVNLEAGWKEQVVSQRRPWYRRFNQVSVIADSVLRRVSGRLFLPHRSFV